MSSSLLGKQDSTHSLSSLPRTLSAEDTEVMLEPTEKGDWYGHSPFNPVFSDSTWASLTAPSSVTRAYLLERSPPNMAAPSKARSSALVNLRSGSARNLIW